MLHLYNTGSPVLVEIVKALPSGDISLSPGCCSSQQGWCGVLADGFERENPFFSFS